MHFLFFVCQFVLRQPPMNTVHVGSPRGEATEVAEFPAYVTVSVCRSTR